MAKKLQLLSPINGIRPYEWSLNSTRTGEGKTWPTIMDLPAEYFYRFDISVPSSFGLPVSGVNGTLVVFDAGSDAQPWYKFYICTVLVGSGGHKIYFAYANSMSNLTWKELAENVEDLTEISNTVNALSTTVAGLDNCIRPYEWSLNSGRTGEGKTWPTIFDLPSNQFYKFITDVPASFGLPVTGKNGTLVVFDCSNSSQTWYRMYLCSVLLNDGTSELYFAYANPNSGVESLKWDKVATNVDKIVQDVVAAIGDGSNERTDGLVFGSSTPKILLLGDSIVAGVGSSDYDASGEQVITKTYDGVTFDIKRNTGAKSWAAQFKDYMENVYPGSTVTNNGWSGVTTWMLSDSMEELVPDGYTHAIVQVGTNSRTATDKTVKIIEPMKVIIDYLREKGVTPIVMTNTVLLNQTAPNDAQNVRQCIMAACVEKGVYCYDVLGEMEWYLSDHGMDASDIMTDDLHPNDDGHVLIFEIYKKLLRVGAGGNLPASGTASSGYIPTPDTATVGQTIVVKEVDENGKPVSWECADVASGWGSGGWRTIADITLEEPAAPIKIDTDMDGNSFSLKEVEIYFCGKTYTRETGAVTDKTTIRVCYNATGWSWATTVFNDEAGRTRQFIRSIFTGTEIISLGHGDSVLKQQVLNSKATSAKSIVISNNGFDGTIAFAEGTRVIVRGVDAK